MFWKKEPIRNEAPRGIPQYAYDYAPVFHLHPTERYHPSSISNFLVHTRPQLDFKDAALPPPAATMADLDRLNALGTKGGMDVYLTSFDDVTLDPPWLHGEVMEHGGAGVEDTGAMIVVEKEGGVVDVFYFCFFAFNWGGIVLGHQIGNHVGDWEHAMIRFINGAPKYAWLSQHANGEAYTFKALQKDSSGKRPILYTAKGTHAIYARPGLIDHTLPNHNSSVPFLLVDECGNGELYDPLPTSLAYTYTLPTAKTTDSNTPLVPGTFHPLPHTTLLPGWLLFTGRWGDAAYPPSDARQKGKDLFGVARYGDGPTGPGFKDLGRGEVWPSNAYKAGQRIRRRVEGGSGWKEIFKGKAGCFGGKGEGKGKRGREAL